jgi:hypothetical protein
MRRCGRGMYNSRNHSFVRTCACFALSCLARSRRMRRSNFPLGFLGMISINSTPPWRCLYFDLLSATYCTEVRTCRLAIPGDRYLDNAGLDLLSVSRGSALCSVGREHHKGKWQLAAILIRDPNYAGINDIWVLQQIALQLCRGDLERPDF